MRRIIVLTAGFSLTNGEIRCQQLQRSCHETPHTTDMPDLDVAPSRGYKLFVLGLLVAVNTLAYADRNLFSVLIPQIKAEFHVSDAMLGLLAGPAFVVPYIIFSIPVARLGDRWSRRGALAIAASLWGLASAASGLVTSFFQLAIARLFVGAGEAGAMPTSQAIISGLFGPKKLAAASGALAACTYLGLIVGIAGGGYIAEAWGWRAAFIALSAPAVFIAPLLWLAAPRNQQNAGTSADQGKDRSLVNGLAAFATNPILRNICIGVGVFHILAYAGSTWIPAYLVRSHGMTLVEAATWLGFAAAVGGFAGSVVGGVLADWGSRYGNQWRMRVPAIGQMITFPVCLALFLWPGSESSIAIIGGVPTVMIFLTIYCFLSALWAAPSYSTIAQLVPENEKAQALATLLVGINLIGSVAGPPLAGFLSDLLTPAAGPEALRYSLLALALMAPLGSLWLWKAASAMRSAVFEAPRRAADPI